MKPEVEKWLEGQYAISQQITELEQKRDKLMPNVKTEEDRREFNRLQGQIILMKNTLRTMKG